MDNVSDRVEALSNTAEAVSKDDKTNVDDWKTKLSSILDEDEMFLSLFIPGIFYVVYAIFKSSFAFTDSNVSDEERFVESCFCPANQQLFFRLLFSLCSLLWLSFHSYTFFTNMCYQI